MYDDQSKEKNIIVRIMLYYFLYTFDKTFLEIKIRKTNKTRTVNSLEKNIYVEKEIISLIF
jgi:predicted transcriptional regulator